MDAQEKETDYRYDAKEADKNSTILRHDSQIGLNMDKNEYLRMNEALKIGHDKGQSIYHIVHISEDVNKCTKSIYNYINHNQVSVKRIDLPRDVMLKKRKQLPKKYEYNENKNIDRSNHTYADWLVYQAKNRIILYWQMDFLGVPHNSEQQILTLTLPQFKFALFVPLENPNNQSVKFVFDELESALGNDYNKVFEAILIDRDSKLIVLKKLK